MPSRRRYSYISLKKRHQLVRLVFEKNYSILKAGRRLTIKPSTAKLIIKKFKETGTFPMRKRIGRSNEIEQLLNFQNPQEDSSQRMIIEPFQSAILPTYFEFDYQKMVWWNTYIYYSNFGYDLSMIRFWPQI